MSRKKVTVDNFASELAKILDDWADDVDDAVNSATEDIAKLGARALNSASGANFKGKRYRRSWTQETRKRRLRHSATIYSRVPGLPHLLEYGHAKANGGRTEGRAHIAPVEQVINESYEKEVIRKIEAM